MFTVLEACEGTAEFTLSHVKESPSGIYLSDSYCSVIFCVVQCMRHTQCEGSNTLYIGNSCQCALKMKEGGHGQTALVENTYYTESFV